MDSLEDLGRCCRKQVREEGTKLDDMQLVQVQLWYRDPQSTSNQTTSLSDAIEACVTP